MPYVSDNCATPGCTSRRVSRGFCDKHYRRAKRAGTLPEKVKLVCEVPGCKSKHYARGRCNYHYNQLRDKEAPRCPISGCANGVRNRGACQKHYAVMVTYGLPDVSHLEEMLSRGCEICGVYTNLAIDHDHSCCPGGKSCGKCIRGTLCKKCNSGLGLLGDAAPAITRALEYLCRTSDSIKGI